LIARSGSGTSSVPFSPTPPNLKADTDSLDATLKAFPPSARVAVEVRDPSWFTDECRRVLERHSSALCLADGGPVKVPEWRTADWGYVRFHRGRASPESCYGEAALRTWAGRLAHHWKSTEDVFAYFNNDAHGCAPRDARRFASSAARAGLEPRRVPGSWETPLTGQKGSVFLNG
jgi:uncharacterized protein YecE (DUF72 family)